jgi:hypothetical protein
MMLIFSNKDELERAIQETREAINAAILLIENQEDGPITMRAALKDIDARLDSIETEVCYLNGTVEKFGAITAKLREQRDEVIRQRDALLTVLRRANRR